MRILDCKEEKCQQLAVGVPELSDNLCEECQDHFHHVKEYLTAAGEKFTLNPRLVRGLDYYTKTAFEVQYTPLGSQSAVAGGGRYDGLVEELDGPHTPAVGFAMGMERLLLALEKQGLLPEPQQEDSVFVVALGEMAQKEAFRITNALRNAYVKAEMEGSGKSMKSQMKYANKINAKYVIIIGDNELAEGKVILKYMDTSEQETVSLAEITNRITELVKGN